MRLKSALTAMLLLLSTLHLYADDLIGKRAWIVGVAADQIGVEVARSPDEIRNTLKMRSGTFVLGKRIQGKHQYDREVTLDDGRKGFISLIGYQFLTLTDPVQAKQVAADDCVRRGPPKIGITSAELVETCWRRPARIVKKTTAAGVEESYVYGIGHVVKVIDGKVSEIVEAR